MSQLKTLWYESYTKKQLDNITLFGKVTLGFLLGYFLWVIGNVLAQLVSFIMEYL